MAAKNESKSKGQKRNTPLMANRVAIIAIAVALVAVSASALYFYYEYGNVGHSASFAAFRSTFNSARNVSIYVVADNGTALGSTVGCATQLLQKILATPQTHRNPDTIGFYILNSTACTYSSSGLGSAIKNYTYTNASNCINFSRTRPSIFLNYSAENRTIITRSNLYLEGNSAFMSECGIAYEIT